jgi:hypothetical protein
MVFDPKIGTTKYVKVGEVKAEKNLIWDNQYYMGAENAPVEGARGLPGTHFKGGGKNIQPGMLLRQVK